MKTKENPRGPGWTLKDEAEYEADEWFEEWIRPTTDLTPQQDLSFQWLNSLQWTTKKALQEAIEAIRKHCIVCHGTGLGEPSEEEDEHGQPLFCHECEYCGRPIGVINDLINQKKAEEDG
jgi:hypothetical protein